jgi:ketopantoate hydroxymethyltransferase
VTHDALGLTDRRPRFVPELGDISDPMRRCFADYVRQVRDGRYPQSQQEYVMDEAERKRFAAGQA